MNGMFLCYFGLSDSVWETAADSVNKKNVANLCFVIDYKLISKMLKNNENRKIIQFQFPRIPFPSFTHLFSRKKQYFPFHDNQVKSSKALLPAPLQQQQLINFQLILTHPLKHTHTQFPGVWLQREGKPQLQQASV